MSYSEVSIIGSGCVGAALFRDFSLHGIHTALFERSDYCTQTSRRSSKMLHGGIRYLEQFDFQLVREALHEKNIWKKLAPELVQEVPFCLPIYQDSKRSRLEISIGLKLYDLLSGFENAPHQILNQQQVKEKFSYLNETALQGAGIYYDAIMDDYQLVLDCLVDGKLSHAQNMLYNYHELIAIEDKKTYQELTFKKYDGSFTQHKTRFVIYALGPFTDHVLAKLYPSWQNCLLPSQGAHLWLDKEKFPLTHSFLVQGADNRVVFFIPHDYAILVGTTETTAPKEIFNIEATKSDISYLLQLANNFFPQFQASESCIIESFAGVRPLVAEDHNTDRGKTSREHKVFRPNSKSFVIVGGKYTTFRTMVQPTVYEICRYLGITYSFSKTISPLRRAHDQQELDTILGTAREPAHINFRKKKAIGQQA
jgi:glycerol-3-phosphate dehydrogenase